MVASDGCGDPDNDNVSNFAGDNCPIHPNPELENTDGDVEGNACDLDDDGDRIPDEDDDCAGTPSGTRVAADGCPDPDLDNVSTHAGDNCPNDFNRDQTDTDRDGQGDACDADDDNDGVAGGADACAGTPSGAAVRPNGCVNTPPVARADAYDTVGGATLSVPALTGVLANDTDAEGDALTAQLVRAPSQGTVVLNANGSFTYTPNENAFGTDTFTYRAHDGMDPSNTVTVTIRVQAGCEGRPATIIGTSGADNLSATSGDDVILALGGDDVIDSGSGNDIVCAGSGNDRVQGGSGNDVLRGGSGDDVLDGGSGDDRLFAEAGSDCLRGGGDNDTLDGGTGTPDRCDVKAVPTPPRRAARPSSACRRSGGARAEHRCAPRHAGPT